jgi:hypothetical protein
MFYLYDLILIQQAYLGNYLQVKKGYWATATGDLARLTGDELHAAAAQFQSKTKTSNLVIHTLINNMRIISSFNPESHGEKIKAESKGHTILCCDVPFVGFYQCIAGYDFAGISLLKCTTGLR